MGGYCVSGEVHPSNWTNRDSPEQQQHEEKSHLLGMGANQANLEDGLDLMTRDEMKETDFIDQVLTRVDPQDIQSFRLPNGFSIATISAFHGYSEILRYLAQNGIDLNQCDAQERTPLFYSMQEQHEECARCILDWMDRDSGTPKICILKLRKVREDGVVLSNGDEVSFQFDLNQMSEGMYRKAWQVRDDQTGESQFVKQRYKRNETIHTTDVSGWDSDTHDYKHGKEILEDIFGNENAVEKGNRHEFVDTLETIDKMSVSRFAIYRVVESSHERFEVGEYLWSDVSTSIEQFKTSLFAKHEDEQYKDPRIDALIPLRVSLDMFAISHLSFVTSHGKFLLRDLQGSYFPASREMVLTDPFVYEWDKFDEEKATYYDQVQIYRWFAGHDCEKCGCSEEMRSFLPAEKYPFISTLFEWGLQTFYAHALIESGHTDPTEWAGLDFEYCSTHLKMGNDDAKIFLDTAKEMLPVQRQNDEPAQAQFVLFDSRRKYLGGVQKNTLERYIFLCDAYFGQTQSSRKVSLFASEIVAVYLLLICDFQEENRSRFIFNENDSGVTQCAALPNKYTTILGSMSIIPHGQMQWKLRLKKKYADDRIQFYVAITSRWDDRNDDFMRQFDGDGFGHKVGGFNWHSKKKEELLLYSSSQISELVTEYVQLDLLDLDVRFDNKSRFYSHPDLRDNSPSHVVGRVEFATDLDHEKRNRLSGSNPNNKECFLTILLDVDEGHVSFSMNGEHVVTVKSVDITKTYRLALTMECRRDVSTEEDLFEVEFV